LTDTYQKTTRAHLKRGREWLVASHEPEIGSHTKAITEGKPQHIYK
jgi:hypothetical protein